MSRSHRGRVLLGAGRSSRVGQLGNRRVIKSLQSGSVALASVATNTATITAVDVNNAILLYQGLSMTVANPNLVICNAILTLTNATTVTATQAGAFGNTVTVPFTVVEFFPGVIRSVQRGTIAASGTSATATINAVDILTSTVMYLGQTSGSAAPNSDSVSVKLVLTNATTVTASTGNTSASDVAYQVIEWF